MDKDSARDEEWGDLRLWQQIAVVTLGVILLFLGSLYRIFVLEDGGWSDVLELTGLLLLVIVLRGLWLIVRRRR